MKKPAEFLSGFSKTDKLSMQATIVIYYGEDPWRGPEKLSDLMDIPGKLKSILTTTESMCFLLMKAMVRSSEIRKSGRC